MTVFLSRFFCASALFFGFVLSLLSQDTIRFYFPNNRATLNEADWKGQWKEACEIGVFSGAKSIAIRGYTDGKGNTEYNQRLSEKRSAYILSKLEKVFKGEIPATGLGESSCSQEVSPSCRRVDVIVDWPILDARAEDVPAPEPTKKTEIKEALAELQVGQKLNFEAIRFQGGSAGILNSSFPALSDLVDAMKENPSLKIEILGHVCCGPRSEDGVDSATGIRNLSEARAKAIYEYIAYYGIDKSRMSYKGYGGSQPLPETVTNPALEELNRRVEILILSK